MRARAGLIALCAFACFAMCAPAWAQGTPWAFPSEAEKERAAKEDGSWPKAYKAATEALEKNSGDLDRVIRQLRFAIAEEPRSTKRKMELVLSTKGVYFPYYYLAVALARKGAWGDAKLCLDKEDKKELEGMRGDVGDGAKKLAADLAAATGAADAVERAQRIASWSRGEGEVVLLSGGAAAEAARVVDESRALAPEPRDAGTGKIASRIDAARTKVDAAATKFYRAEVEARLALLTGVSAEGWKALGVAAPPADARAACAWNAGSPADSEKQLLRCAGLVDSKVRDGVRRGCEAISAADRDADTAFAAARAWASALGKPAPAPQAKEGPPPVCSGSGASASDLQTIPRRVESALARFNKAVAERDALRDEARAVVKKALASAPAPPRGCAEALGAAAARRPLDASSRVLADALVADEPPEGVGPALKSVGRDARAVYDALANGARRLAGAPGPDVSPQAVAALQAALDAFRPESVAEAQMRAFCDAVRPVAGASREAAKAMAERRAAIEAMLVVASETDLDRAVTACSREAREALRAGAGDDALVEGEACGTTARAAALAFADSIDRTSAALEDIDGRAARFASAFGDAGAATSRLGEASRDAASRDARLLREALSRLSAFVRNGPVDAAGLGAALRSAGIEARVPQNWATALRAALSASEDDGRAVALVARAGLADVHARDVLGAFEAQHRDTIEGWDAALLVRESLTQAMAGDLDGAITRLRGAEIGIPGLRAGRGVATQRAMLGSLLILRARAESEGSPAARALEAEAERVLSEAQAIAPGMVLPEPLFPDPVRRRWEETRRGGR